jgi:hypothetical protein
MRQVAGRKLWLGHIGDLREPRPLLSSGIEAIIELADNEVFATLPRNLIRCRFPLSDGGENPLWLLRLAAHSVAALLTTGVPTIVCCSCGMNRSVCVAGAGVAIAERLTLDEAVKVVVGAGPADVSVRLFEELRKALVGTDPFSGRPRGDAGERRPEGDR